MKGELGRAELGTWNHRHKRLGYQAKVQLEGLRAPLRLIGLDTSWLAGDEHDTGSCGSPSTNSGSTPLIQKAPNYPAFAWR